MAVTVRTVMVMVMRWKCCFTCIVI